MMFAKAWLVLVRSPSCSGVTLVEAFHEDSYAGCYIEAWEESEEKAYSHRRIVAICTGEVKVFCS